MWDRGCNAGEVSAHATPFALQVERKPVGLHREWDIGQNVGLRRGVD